MPLLGVNIDHVATLRQARREEEPDPVQAALICQKAGADSIVAHLREDRRHIHDEDIRRLRAALRIPFNLEMAIHPEIIDIACRIRPAQVTLVPEKRRELTTEGGLDVIGNFRRLKSACRRFTDLGIRVSFFIDPLKDQIETSRELVDMIEIHTGKYACAKRATLRGELKILRQMTDHAVRLGFIVNAGHGLKYDNVSPVAGISGMNELNIGHSIISRAVFVGLERAVREMKSLVKL